MTIIKTKVRRVDIHHHFFPPTLNKSKQNADVGWRTPEGILPWTEEKSLRSMDASGVDVAILSFPAIPAGFVGEENRAAARKLNEYVREIRDRHPDRFGFFATLPFLDDVQGAIAEIAYALDELKADGIGMPSSYGVGDQAKYIGDDMYDPVWAELDRRGAVVFVHGTQTASSTPYPHEFLGIPIVEAPNETFKAAAHLVVTGRKRKYPNAKIILAHLGGTTPFLAPRIAILSTHMGCSLSPDEVIQDFKSFYYDTALSAHETTLTTIENFVDPDRILFGTDFPAVSTEMADWYTQNLVKYYANDDDRLDIIMRRNALRLFPRLNDL